MSTRLSPISPLVREVGGPGLEMDSLPSIRPLFFVPRLLEKPQNPILDTLKSNVPLAERALPLELVILTQDIVPLWTHKNKDDNLWSHVGSLPAGGRIMSWDALRPTSSERASSMPFLSEQSNHVFAAARYHIQPPLRDPSREMLYVTQHDLLKSLKMTVLGTSSPFHQWNSITERFVQGNTIDGEKGVILIDGKDEVVSQSIIDRFLTIGTLLRRLEIFVASVRSRYSHEGPAVHAFAHGLSSILDYLRHSLARSPPSDETGPIESRALSAIWLHFGEYEEILLALSSLCHRAKEFAPVTYPVFDPSPVPLLSRIYDHLDMHLQRCSPQAITRIFAYILTNASQDYFHHVCFSVGLGAQHSHPVGEKSRSTQFSEIAEDDEDEEEDGIFSDRVCEEDFPSFFASDLADSLPTAKRSLRLLKAACPEHPLLADAKFYGGISWFWTDADVQSAWHKMQAASPRESGQNIINEPDTKSSSVLSVYRPELEHFHIFDLEPGSHLAKAATTEKSSTAAGSSRQAFIATFPESLPSLTPTLSHLTVLVLSPLADHIARLSSTLLSLFISPGSTLNLHAHLVLLRSYLLLTSHPFKSRLAIALFSDLEGDDLDQGVKLLTRARRKTAELSTAERPWAVGLAPALTERDTWPPGGADLSFYLRTVIVDSLEPGGDARIRRETEGPDDPDSKIPQEQVVQEAEFRLGFAIRDLPLGPGRDRWLNPLSIEALDFLYMDYKPPQPLRILISPEILSKYQRIFAFILRMMRVESVIRALYRMIRKGSEALFPTISASNKLLLHFRFIAHSFVTSLSSYVFDVVIRGNFDAFLSRLSPDNIAFSDVFSLASAHSAVLDEILSACLLRSGQRAVGDLLRGILELVLDFGILAGELRKGRLEEYQAAPQLEDLFRAFRGKMRTLIKVLKGLVDKGSASKSPLGSSVPRRNEDETYQPVSGTEALHHLLVRLDVGDWWSRS